ncbi:hypothetical protein PN441_15830 [Spirulina major CS-329]|uniref:hypothetical protein n=1 Tax=Spirulina subsalsa TaxID=54311 RepID=UPI00232BF0E0|nr:hypothetical protein [Spirulina subsalsa]MDB9504547.1 hypothetical protein [Spirulina major CS-329]
MGYQFDPEGLAVAQKTIDRMVAKVDQLHEQGADDVRVGAYLRHWLSWVKGGLDAIAKNFGSFTLCSGIFHRLYLWDVLVNDPCNTKFFSLLRSPSV